MAPFNRNSRARGKPDPKKLRFGFSTRRKICRFCENKADFIDYKDEKILRRFVNERGKIIPRRISGNCASHQREMTRALKRGRQLGLIPFQAEAYE